MQDQRSATKSKDLKYFNQEFEKKSQALIDAFNRDKAAEAKANAQKAAAEEIFSVASFFFPSNWLLSPLPDSEPSEKKEPEVQKNILVIGSEEFQDFTSFCEELFQFYKKEAKDALDKRSSGFLGFG